MEQYQKVQGHNNLVRDKKTGTILNTNKNEIVQARKLKETRQREKHKIESLTEEVSNLKQDIDEIKSLLFRLVEDNNGTR
jgi:hypothetical protein